MSKILLVEDDQDLSDMISGWLKSERYTVEAAYDGDLAREILKISSFDVVVLDWDLPSCSGIEILREFRENGGSTPVIMLTGKSTITDKETGLDIGADEYLTKPGENGGFLLKQNVGSLPHNSEVNVSLTYADYYFLEAMLRYKNWYLKK